MFKIQERIQHFRYLPSQGLFLAVGRLGGVYALDRDLRCLRQSPRGASRQPISALAVTDEYVFTRDNLGALTRWRLADLVPLDTVQTGMIQGLPDEDMVESVRSVSHGLTVFHGSVYVVSGSGQLLEFDCETLTLKRLLDPNPNSYIETIETSQERCHVLSDFSGWIWAGDLDTGHFRKVVQVDKGPSHCVAFDKLHGRYWASTDNQGGFALVDIAAGRAEHIRMTSDDVEWISFDASCSTAYVACFDHHLYVYDNSGDKPLLVQKVGPFKFQLKQVLVVDSTPFVLLESGEIFRLDAAGKTLTQSDWQGNCVWGFCPVVDDPGRYLCALEDGSIRRIKVEYHPLGDVDMCELASFKYDFGRLRRVVSLAGGGFIACATDGTVIRADEQGAVVWRCRVSGICRDLALSPDGLCVAVANESQTAVELATETGDIIRSFTTPGPSWAACYLVDGRLLIGLRRYTILVFAPTAFDVLTSFNYRDNVKGIAQLNDGTVIVNGPSGAVTYDTGAFTKLKVYDEGITTTCESVAVADGRIYAVSYDLSLTLFDEATTVLADQQVLVHDFPKVIRCHVSPGAPTILLIAGRGPYIAALRVVTGKPFKVRELFLKSHHQDSEDS